MAEEKRKISELPSNDSPSTSTILVGVDNGETVKIPITEFVTQDEDGNVEVNKLTASDSIECFGTLDIREGYIAKFWSEDESKYVSIWCDDDGNLSLNGKPIATEDGASNSIPYTSFQCFSTSYTIGDLINQLQDEGVSNISGQPIIVSFTGMLSGTFLCRLNNYYGIYYGCEFTDLKELKTYYFEGQSPSLSLYENLSSGGTSPGDGSSGDSSIIDLGAQANHKDAQQAMIDHATELTDGLIDANGCLLFKYYCTCYGNACFAVVSYSIGSDNNLFCNGAVYDDQRDFREFTYDSVEGFTKDGCWLQMSSFNEEIDYLPTENKSVLGAIEELHSKIAELESRIAALGGN